MLTEILVIVALVLLNGVLAGAEIAIVAVRKTRIAHLLEEGKGAAKAVRRLHQNPERFLATVQVGITVVGATAGAFGGATFARDLEPLIRLVPALAPRASEIALALVVVIVSYLSIVLGELCPKSLALRAPERYALLVGRPLLALSWLARPFVWLLTASSNLLLRPFGDRTNFTESRLSPDELQQLVDEATEAGAVDPTAGAIAARAFDFAGLTARHVMVPRSRVIALPRGADPEHVRRVVLEEGHTRMPVYEGTPDNVVGYVTVKDLIALFWERGLIVLEDAIRPAYFVPETLRAADVLGEMRKRRMQLAVVVDEAGAMSGIVTLEDLVEEIVGEIWSEHDEDLAEPIRPQPDGSFLVQGDVPVRVVNRELGLDLLEAEGFSTVAGLCIVLAERIPETGRRLTARDGTVLEVVDATARQVRTVRVIPHKAPEESESA